MISHLSELSGLIFYKTFIVVKTYNKIYCFNHFKYGVVLTILKFLCNRSLEFSPYKN